MPAEALLKALEHVWRTLQPLGRPMAVTGGLALATWKYSRATRDVDLLFELGKEHLGEVLSLLSAAGVRAKRTPPVIELGPLNLVQLLYEPPETFVDLQVDLLLADSDYHRQALRRRVPVQLPGLELEIAVLSCEDLILYKLLAGRLIDQVDAAALLRANRPRIDLGYLLAWTGHLNLGPELTEVWREAFPGESLPQTAE